MNVEEIAQQIAYRHHRCRVKDAKAIIDVAAPELHAGNFARFSKMKEDIDTLMARHRANARLLVAMNKVLRTKGVIDSFRTTKNSFTPPYSNLLQRQEWVQVVDEENLKMGQMILSAKPEIDTWLDKKFIRKRSHKSPHVFRYPSLVMQKYSKIELSNDMWEIKKFLRPKIWFELEIRGVRPIGRISIELYTEAAPQVVLELVRFCFAQQTERFQFIRLFPRLWLEGSLRLQRDTIMCRNIEFDKRCLDHGDSMGVLSFSVKNVLNLSRSTMNFSISFKPLSVCNGRRVGFGRVCEGLRILKSIEEFGNKNGKLYRDIVLKECGVEN